MEPVKCVIVGDGAVGKSCMLLSYTQDSFPIEEVLTVFDNYVAYVMVDGRPISLYIWDTAGQAEYDRLRPLSYPNTDVFIICYSTTSRTSLENAKAKWLPEIRGHCPNTPVVLVGTKCDVRKNSKDHKRLQSKGVECTFVDADNAKKVGDEIGAARVMQCSAKTQEGLDNVFGEVIKVALTSRFKSKKKRKKCVLL